MKTLSFGVWALLGAVLSVGLSSCIDDDDQSDNLNNSVSVSYAQTQCADPWGQALTTQDLVTAATAYLSRRSVQLYKPQATASGTPAVCAACVCPTGLVLRAAVRSQDVATLQALGFTVD